ncbi:hypothetical protein, partial [Porphyromonas endodontalis]
LSLYHKWKNYFIDNICPPSEFSGGVSTQKIHPQNDVVGGLKKTPYLCTTSGKITSLIIYAPPSEFSGGVSTQKIHPQNDVER